MPTSAFLRKLRGFVISKSTGLPLPNVSVLFQSVTVDNAKEKVSPLGLLVSDTAGYLSFDLSLFDPKSLPPQVRITATGDKKLLVDVRLSEVDFARPSANFVLEADGAKVKNTATTNLPSIQNPDDLDREISPYSFGVKTDIHLGEGDCQTPIPTPFAVREFRIARMVVPAHMDEGGSMPSLNSAADPLFDPKSVNTITGLYVKTADIYEFKQSWIPAGHSLGQIVYSLPLAPCESVNLAVIEWARQDSISRRDTGRATESLAHEQRYDRSIEESVEAALTEEQGGFSMMHGMSSGESGGAAATIPVEGVPISLNAAHANMISNGGAIAFTMGNRDLSAESMQDINARTRQASSLVRTMNSTVVTQATQEEKSRLETRTVTNHNHCHALTVQYYEVLRNFKIVTEFVRKRKAFLVPYKVNNFNQQTALRFRGILQSVLRDRSLLKCFEAMARLEYCADAYDKASAGGGTSGSGTTTSTEEKAISSYALTIHFGNKLRDSRCFGRLWVNLKTSDGKVHELFFKPALPKIGESEPTGTEGIKGYTIDGEVTKNVVVTSNDDLRLKPSSVIGVQVAWRQHSSTERWELKGISLGYSTDDVQNRRFLISGETDLNDPNNLMVFQGDISDPSRNWEGPVSLQPADPATDPHSTPEPPPIPGDKTGTSEVITKDRDQCCANRLLGHLNENQGFYNRAIWILQDPTERKIMLAALGLADLTDGNPVGVSGNYVAFAIDDPRLDNVLLTVEVQQALTDIGLAQTDIDRIWNLATERQPKKPAPPEPEVAYVALPTRGLFAEAQLGHCNSCEVRDVTRFWDWSESPCEKAPTIEGISPGPRGQTPNITPQGFPQAVVQIQQPPAVPDPTAMAGALQVLRTPDIFRDMSGLKEVEDLLEKLADGTITSMSEARKAAVEMQSKLPKSMSGGSGSVGSGVSGSGASTRSAPSENDAKKQIDKINAIDYAKEKGLINDQDATDSVKGVLGGEEFPGYQLAQYDGGTSGGQLASYPLNDALIGDSAGDVDLSASIVDYLSGLTNELDGSCVSVSAGHFTKAMKKLGVKTEKINTDEGTFEFPVIATANSTKLPIRVLLTLWYSLNFMENWLKLPTRCRGAGAPGALLYADLVEGRSFLTSESAWPSGMLPGAHIQLWPSRQEYEDLRDKGEQPGLGHSCIFERYVQGDPVRIVVTDNGGNSHQLRYGWLGLRYVIAANLSKARFLRLGI